MSEKMDLSRINEVTGIDPLQEVLGGMDFQGSYRSLEKKTDIRSS